MNDFEAAWLDRAKRGDEDAFCHLIDQYQKPVYNLCYRMTGDAWDAEDAAQETFLRAFQSLKRYDPDRSFITWLLSIAAHYCIDQLRRKRLPAIDLDALPDDIVPDYGPGPESQASQSEEQRALRSLLNRLGPQDRAAIILRYWYDLSDDEIAKTLSLTVSAVKSRLHRSRLELARLWQEKQAQSVGIS